MKKIVIYDFIDYTRYLNAWFDAKKEANANFSHKSFAEKVGLKSSSYVTMILNHTRKVPRKQILSFAKALDLNSKETKYFEAIILYKESKNFDEKRYYWDIAQNLRPLTDPYIIERKQFDYFNNWYIPVLREVVTYFDFKKDFALLGKQLNPPISKKEAETGFNTLLDLKLIKAIETKVSKGSLTYKSKPTLYELTNNLIVTPPENRMVAVHHFQRETIELAKSALDQLNTSERNIQNTTIGTSAQGLFEINRLIEDFQAQLLKIAENNPETEGVYHVNIQLYPLTVEKK
ncbi:MAG: TIGR02147 family protein [Fibrobacterales bacterium]